MMGAVTLPCSAVARVRAKRRKLPRVRIERSIDSKRSRGAPSWRLSSSEDAFVFEDEVDYDTYSTYAWPRRPQGACTSGSTAPPRGLTGSQILIFSTS